MLISLIRHGKTAANERHLYCGSTDLLLSASGASEITAFKKRGIYPAADCFFTSGLWRAAETLRLIYGNVPATPIRELAEYRFGDFEMRSHAALEPVAAYQDWIRDETGEARPPSGESRNEFRERVLRGWRVLLEAAGDGKNVSAAVVTHGGVIATLLDILLPGQRGFYEWQPKPGCGYILQLEKQTFQLKGAIQ